MATAVSNAVLTLDRDPDSGALTQATDGTGCIANAALTGCTKGIQVAGANAVVVSPDGVDVYVTSLISKSVTSFTRAQSGGDLTQKSGTEACAIYLFANGCSLARALKAPEGIAISPDGANVYAAAFKSDAIATFNRDPETGGLMQKSNKAGCVTSDAVPDCKRGRKLAEVSSLAVSPDGRRLYGTAFKSNAVVSFKRRGLGQ